MQADALNYTDVVRRILARGSQADTKKRYVTRLMCFVPMLLIGVLRLATDFRPLFEVKEQHADTNEKK